MLFTEGKGRGIPFRQHAVNPSLGCPLITNRAQETGLNGTRPSLSDRHWATGAFDILINNCVLLELSPILGD